MPASSEDQVIPRYGSGALSDVVPSLMTALGVPGFGAPLTVTPARAVCLLLVDGMGERLLREHAGHAPFLAGLATASTPITAGFPASTTTSITSVGTGRPPGEHGIVGYSFLARPSGEGPVGVSPGTSAGPGAVGAGGAAGPGVAGVGRMAGLGTAGFGGASGAAAAGAGGAAGPGPVGVHGGWWHDELLEALTWRVDGQDARERFVPEQVQPWPTAMQLAAAAGVTVRLAVPAWHGGSGLTRAALRGGTLTGTFVMGDIAATAASALATPGPVFCYAYHGGLDLVGHLYGPGSPAWCFELAQVDLLASQIAGALPPDGLLAVVADHGMVPSPPHERVDIDSSPELTDGVLLIGGDSRARAVYPVPGATADVLATWRAALGDRATVLSRDDAVAAGWFGPVVTEAALSRIADVLAVATGTTTLVRTTAEPRQSAMLGVHGGLSAAEQLIPFLTVRP